MKIRSKKLFSVLELLIVMAIMAILATMIFVVVKGVKESTRMVQTEATIRTCKTSMENLYNYIYNQSRADSIEVYNHPLFRKVWPSNKVWTFRDKDETDNGITSNGFGNMMSIGNLSANEKISTIKMKYPDSATPLETLVDGWGYPILVMRNEMPWFVKKLNPNDNVVEKVYKDRTKASLGVYAKYMFRTDGTGQNLFEWNDSGFNHAEIDIESKKETIPAYEVAPLLADTYRFVQIHGKIAVPYNSNDFDFFSPGKDGKIGNLIKDDMKQDRWTEVLNKEGALKWVPASASKVDPDSDNVVSFNRYIME